MRALICSLLITILLPQPIVPATNYRTLAAKDMRASVLLHIKGIAKDHEGHLHKVMVECSGTYINPTTILTAAHCIEGYMPTNMWARGANDALGYPVNHGIADFKLDLMTVQAPYKHHWVALGKVPRLGDDIMSIGSPFDFEFVASQGIVAALHYRVRGFFGAYTVHTSTINPGSSGGGLFDRHGRLVGVNCMTVGFSGWNGLSLAADTDTIHRFLREAGFEEGKP